MHADPNLRDLDLSLGLVLSLVLSLVLVHLKLLSHAKLPMTSDQIDSEN